MSSSCLIASRRSGRGLLGSCEGSVADFGVFKAGKVGLGDLGDVVLMVGGAAFSVLIVGGSVAGGAGCSISTAEGMMTVDLERPRCQMNDSRRDLTGDAYDGPKE